MKDFSELPKLVSGKGVWLYDEDQNPYLDAIASWWVTCHGHSHPHIAQKVFDQMMKLEHAIFAGFTHQPAIELCERLKPYLPESAWKFFFSDNGSTAVEVALKMAIHYYTQKLNASEVQVFAIEGAYHGDTFGAMSAGERGAFSAPYDRYLFPVHFMPAPSLNSLEECKKIFEENKGEHNLFIFEPLVLGAAGMVMYDADSLDHLLKCMKENNTILIADEVMTGFGRLGSWFATNQFSVVPDLICLSKALTGGALPMSLTVAKQWLYDVFLDDKFEQAFLHGHSFTGNPVGCAAALASLDLMEQEETWDNIKRIESSHRKAKLELEKIPELTNVRVKGTILAMEFVTNDENTYLNPVRMILQKGFMKRGLLIRPLGNTIYLLPPFVISEDELQLCYKGITDVVEEVKASKLEADVHR